MAPDSTDYDKHRIEQELENMEDWENHNLEYSIDDNKVEFLKGGTTVAEMQPEEVEEYSSLEDYVEDTISALPVGEELVIYDIEDHQAWIQSSETVDLSEMH